MALPSTPYDPLFQEAGEKHGVDPAILKAIASVESDFRPDAVGPRTRSGQAKGMMQFVPATAKAYGLEDPFNPEQSVDAAARLMKDLLRQFNGNVGDALEAYNGGPRLVGKSKQTAAYRQKVLQRAKLTDSTQFAAKTPPATAKTPPASQTMPPVRDRVALSSVDDLPAGYKAAIALQYFTDLDPEGNPIESAEQTLAELREARELDSIAEAAPSGGGALLQKFFAAKNKGSVSPFDIMAGMQQEEQPTDQEPAQVAQVQGFANGGFAFRGTSLPGVPNPALNEYSILPQKEREFLQAQQDYYDRYVAGFPGYEAEIEKYNKAIEAWNAGPRTSDFNVPEPKAPRPPDFDVEGYTEYVNRKMADVERARRLAPQQELALDVVNDPGKYNLSGFGFSAGGAADKQSMLEKVKRFIVENDLTPADFMLTPRTIPLGMMLQPSEANAGEAEMLERYRRMAEQEQGKVVGRAKGSGPRAEEVPQIDASGRVVLPEPTPEEERSLLEQLYGLGEAGLGAVTGMASAIPGSLYGAYKGLTSDKYGTPEGVREAEAAAGNVMEAMTFTPRSETGKERLQQFSEMIPQELTGAMPQSQLMNLRVNPGAAKYLGDRAVEATERGVMPIIRSQTENPDLQPADVYGAMLTSPGETIKAGALAATPVKINRDLFSNATEELDKIPTSPEVDQVLSAHIGGVGDFGDPDAKYYLGRVSGGPEYTQHSQSIAKKYFGDEFMGYRLMPKEEFEALKAGDVGDLLSFSLSKDAANSFRRFAPNQKREDLILAEVPLTPNHVLAFGSRGEQEVIVDTSVGWSMDAFKRASAPKQKTEVDRSLLFPSAERPFVGELERRVADLPGPVQKEQFINSLRKTAREHEMVRLEQALENYGPKDKLTPNQIMSLLKDTSPQRYQLEVLEPQANRFYAGQDTPYPSLPLGTANLLLEPKQLQREIVGLMDEAQYMRSSMFADSIASDETKLKEFLTNINELADRAEDFDTDVSRKLKQATENFYEKVEPIAAASRVRQYVSYPSLSSNPDGLSNVVFSNLEGTLPPKIKTVLSNRGIDFTDNRKTSVTALFLAAREAAMVDYLKSMKALADTENDAGTYLKYTMSASERDKLNEMLSPDATWKEELGEFYKAAQEIDANKSLPIAEKHEIGNRIGQEFATRVNEMLSDFDYNLTATRKAVAEDLRAMPQMVLDSETLQENKLFEGTHTSVVRKNPISFSRYVDLDADQHNLPDPRGAMLFTELQSDRRKAVKKGAPGVEEPYPGMTKLSEDTLRELMAKAAVAATARRGKGIALFPSTDSQKAGLYSNMDRIAKKVAKDLGEGYQARQFDVVNEAGDMIKRWGIVLPDNASELPQKGIRFAKGGLVDKPTYNRA